jgi:hypothetical protein
VDQPPIIRNANGAWSSVKAATHDSRPSQRTEQAIELGSPRSVGRRYDDHINTDHADAMVIYCKAFLHETEITSASMTGVDRYGFDMSAITSNGPQPVRLAFGKPVSTPEEVRAALISMVKDARSKLAEGTL